MLKKKTTEIAVATPTEITISKDTSVFSNSLAFDFVQRTAKMFASSTIVPKEYQGTRLQMH